MKVTIAPDFQNLLPSPSAEELAQMEANIVAHPAAFPPCVVWGNHHNTLIEGHHRHRLFAKHGLIPKYLKLNFDSRDEAIAYAKSCQTGRRNMPAEQLAMLATKRPAESTEQDTEQKTTRRKGASTKQIAEETGVSQRTVQKAQQVREAAEPEVIEAVERGEMSLDKAVETTRPTKPKPKPKPEEPLTDEEGEIVPEKLAAIFRQGAEFEERAKALALIQKWAQDIAEEDVAFWFHVQSFTADLNNAKQALRFNKPYAVCPYCQAKKPKCDACKGKGFVSKGIYKAAPAELRA